MYKSNYRHGHTTTSEALQKQVSTHSTALQEALLNYTGHTKTVFMQHDKSGLYFDGDIIVRAATVDALCEKELGPELCSMPCWQLGNAPEAIQQENRRTRWR